MMWLRNIDRNDGAAQPGAVARIGRAAMQLLGRQRGITLMETVVGMAVLGLIGVGFMSALASTFRATEINDEKVIAENLIRTQLEYLRSQIYCKASSQPSFVIPTDGDCDTYDVPPSGVTLPTGYTMTVELSNYCCDSSQSDYNPEEIQVITARVYRDGKLVTQISDLKTKR